VYKINHRIAIAKLFNAGNKTLNFIQDTGYGPRTVSVYQAVAKLKEVKGIENLSNSSRSDEIRT